jgi:YidC/Oxa1 family membrane protein insertase
MLWIQDLSAPDSFFILPILMGITFYLQQKLSPQSATMDPNMQAIMKWIPVLFTVMFLWLPSGLVLYFVTSNTWSIAQQYLITKQLENKENNK